MSLLFVQCSSFCLVFYVLQIDAFADLTYYRVTMLLKSLKWEHILTEWKFKYSRFDVKSQTDD